MEAIFLACGAGGPQLKRNPLGRAREITFLAQILSDAQARPDLFIWNGPIPAETLTNWLSAQDLRLPDEFFAFLIATGGGEAFESESIFGPFGDSASGEDLLGANAELRSRGLPTGYLLFHSGLCLSAIRYPDLAYLVLSNDTFREQAVFPSFEAWYLNTLRDEYGPRYGLPIIGAA